MGTWDTGHFDNDSAADFAGALDDAPAEARESMVRAALLRAADETDHLDHTEAVEAVASAALVAARCPGGEPVTTAYGPDEPVPLTAVDDLRELAVQALDRVLAAESELADLWDEAVDGPAWRRGIARLRAALDPHPAPPQDALFEL
ncbi:DUF4259 domain-containing protein [Kitasatospora sp. NPDC051914]|uniref:DUF4259 domain-containing protein n=1 Tax=Kitasatospora sp. NPDC051914 TaxID=3154945 RepID=UPI00342851EC